MISNREVVFQADSWTQNVEGGRNLQNQLAIPTPPYFKIKKLRPKDLLNTVGSTRPEETSS